MLFMLTGEPVSFLCKVDVRSVDLVSFPAIRHVCSLCSCWFKCLWIYLKAVEGSWWVVRIIVSSTIIHVIVVHVVWL